MSETTPKLLSNLNAAIFDLEKRMVEETARVRQTEEDIHYHRLISTYNECTKAGCAGVDPVYAAREIFMNTLVDLHPRFPDGTVGRMIIP